MNRPEYHGAVACMVLALVIAFVAAGWAAEASRRGARVSAVATVPDGEGSTPSATVPRRDDGSLPSSPVGPGAPPLSLDYDGAGGGK